MLNKNKGQTFGEWVSGLLTNDRNTRRQGLGKAGLGRSHSVRSKYPGAVEGWLQGKFRVRTLA